jgi:hypothetical protein
MSLTFQQQLQTIMDYQQVANTPDFVHKVAKNLFEHYFKDAAQKSAPSVNIEWDVLMNMVGGNHGNADAVVRYLEQEQGLKITNAVPSGEIICIRWGKVRPPLKY